MAQEFIKNGYEVVNHEEKADVYVVNTCTVTNIADRKSRQMLNRAKKINPDALIIAMGCYAQANAKKILDLKLADIVLGINNKKEIETKMAFSNSVISDIMDTEEAASYPVASSLYLRTILMPLYPRLRASQIEIIAKVLATLP